MKRLNTMIQARKNNMKKPNVVDMNRTTSIPKAEARKQNKNDFYRFLLSTSRMGVEDDRVNNDVLIPRSILKKSYIPGSTKE